jgi:hypothetical protein
MSGAGDIALVIEGCPSYCPKMLIFEAAKGLISGNHPFNQIFFKLGAMLQKRVKGQCAGVAIRSRNLCFFMKMLLPDS